MFGVGFWSLNTITLSNWLRRKGKGGKGSSCRDRGFLERKMEQKY